MKLKYKSPYTLAYGKQGDSGLDLRCLESIIVKADYVTIKISTGVFLELPKGYEAQVRPRSSLSAKGIWVHLGTIDNGYRGEVIVTMSNLNLGDYKLNAGDKIAQLVIVPIEQAELIQVAEIDPNTERGATGFGSTGK